jgi:antitoxin component of RelBE/YafQ-DinJ toxin-antitoxin module
MAATTLVRARVNTDRVKKVSRILSRMGLKPADLVNMVFARTEQAATIPFPLLDEGADYVRREYGVTDADMARFVQRQRLHLARERKAGTIHPVRSADDLL